ncbi:MAG: hypothetical protein Q4A30_00015 [Candidatus Saccharibacteria bacterium]|nr:hypothetical protein [Candidatus Saccharibacteria bacterium]
MKFCLRSHRFRSRRSVSGFTLVELSLAITFVSLLLLAIAFLTFFITGTYQKGMAIKAITSTGRELIDEFSRSISTSHAKDTLALCASKYSDPHTRDRCIRDGARKFIFQQQTGIVEVNNQNKAVPINGVFCTGRYSYLWNTGYVMNDKIYPGGNNLKATYNGNSNFRLLKIEDSNRALCTQHMIANQYAYDASNHHYLATAADGIIGHPQEILSSAEENLALFSLEIFRPTQHHLTLHAFYSGTFILGTVQGGVDITGAGDYCTLSPEHPASDFNYCAINKFNFAMRATGELKSNEK